MLSLSQRLQAEPRRRLGFAIVILTSPLTTVMAWLLSASEAEEAGRHTARCRFRKDGELGCEIRWYARERRRRSSVGARRFEVRAVRGVGWRKAQKNVGKARRAPSRRHDRTKAVLGLVWQAQAGRLVRAGGRWLRLNDRPSLQDGARAPAAARAIGADGRHAERGARWEGAVVAGAPVTRWCCATKLKRATSVWRSLRSLTFALPSSMCQLPSSSSSLHPLLQPPFSPNPSLTTQAHKYIPPKAQQSP